MASPPQFALCRDSPGSAVMALLRALCAVAEGADVVEGTAGAKICCIAAVLRDPLRRLCVMGGREDMRRSLGSVLAGSVVRFLGGFCGVERRRISTFGRVSYFNGIAVTRDGSLILLTSTRITWHGVHVFDGHNYAFVRAVGDYGTGPLQFNFPNQLCISCDDHVFVADTYNHRIQVLTPRLDFHGFVGAEQLNLPVGVCADQHTVFVVQRSDLLVCVFSRDDGALLRRFGSAGNAHDQLDLPHAMCLIGDTRQIAVADHRNRRVSVFSAEGEFVRHVGVGKLSLPTGVTCSAFGELVVADADGDQVVVFRASGEVSYGVKPAGYCFGVAIHGSTLICQLHCSCNRGPRPAGELKMFT
jgi:hypothetical protein